MDLISCGNCGIVLNKDEITEPDIIEDEINGIDESTARWSSNDRDFKPIITCPVCKKTIFYETGEWA